MSLLARVHSAAALLTVSHSSFSTVLGLLGDPLLLAHQDRQRDVVGVLADDRLEFPSLEEVLLTLAQVQRHIGAAFGARDGLDFELARSVARPAHASRFQPAGAIRP